MSIKVLNQCNRNIRLPTVLIRSRLLKIAVGLYFSILSMVIILAFK